MDSKLLLVKSITLLYRESQLLSLKGNSAPLVREIVAKIKPADVTLDTGEGRDILTSLTRTALAMCDDSTDHSYVLSEILQRVKVNTGNDVELYEAVVGGIVGDLTEGDLAKYCANIRRTLMNFQREERVTDLFNKAAYRLRFDRGNIDWKTFVGDAYNELEEHMGGGDDSHPAIIDDLDLDDQEGLTKTFDEVKANDSGVGIMVTGYQGLNRMLDGGFRRGEEVVIGALQHKYKTGFSLSLFKQIALYNKPYMIDPAKKPLLVRISFEDSAALNTQFLYTSLYENATGQKANLMNVTSAEMAAYVKQSLTINGYSIKLLKIDPTQFTYRDICNKLLQYEAEGYEVHMLMLDYLAMIPTTGCTQGAMGQDVRDLYRRMRNFCEPRKITLITPHQLSTEAKLKIRDKALNFVTQLVDGGFYDKCKTVDNEVDIELFIHIEIVNGKSYLTIQRGKHRKTNPTPLEHLYCVLPFSEIGGIRDDIHGPDTSRKKVGGGAVGSGEDITPFWEFDEAA